ncbi:MAG: hypothetical protein KBE43_17060, partial [Candidatus Microthrix sp.]
MLDHLSIQCSDLEAGARFYDQVLATVGGQRIMQFPGVIGYGVPPMPTFWLGEQARGDGFRESHIAFAAPGSGRQQRRSGLPLPRLTPPRQGQQQRGSAV